MSKERGLGKGFDALIPTVLSSPQLANAASGDMVRQLDPSTIAPNPEQPRTNFNPEELEGLAQSIREHGILQPLVVSDLGGGKYELIAGERRLRAAKLARLDAVPAIIRSFDQQQKLELAIIENIQRAELNPIETAMAYRKLVDEFNLTIEQLGARLGQPRSTVNNVLRMLALRPIARQALIEGRINVGHAKAILSVSDPKKQDEATELIMKNGWSVRQAEEFGRAFNAPSASKEKGMERIAGSNDLTEKLTAYFGTKVFIQPTARGGRLVIEYTSDEELNRIYGTIRPDQS